LAGAVLCSFLLLPSVKAENNTDTRTVYSTSDFFVVVNEQATLTVRTLLCDEPNVLWCASTEDGGHFVDSMLWIYASDGTLLAESDDDGVSWASLLVIELQPAVYRLRAGKYVCFDGSCSHPEYPFPVGGWYVLDSSLPLVLDPAPPEASPPPVPSELPSEVPSSEPSATPTAAPSEAPSEMPTGSPSEAPSPSEWASIAPSPRPSPRVSFLPSEEPSASPIAEPSADYTPAPSVEPPQDGGIGGEIASAVGNAAEAVSAVVGVAAERLTTLGNDLTVEQKEKAAPVAVAIVVSQLASAAVAAVSASSGGGSSKSSRKVER